MPPVDEVRLLPDPEQHTLLAATLERVNRASNAARAAAPPRPDRATLRAIVKAEVDRVKLPETFVSPIAERVEAALGRRGKQQKFTTYQSLTLAASTVRWPGADRVTLPTAAGRRTIPVRVDMARGSLRPPLQGRPVRLVFRNGEFDLAADDVADAGAEDTDDNLDAPADPESE